MATEPEYIQEAKRPIVARTGERPDNVTMITSTDCEGEGSWWYLVDKMIAATFPSGTAQCEVPIAAAVCRFSRQGATSST